MKEHSIRRGTWLSFPKGLKTILSNPKEPVVAVMVEVSDEYPDAPFRLEVFTQKGKLLGAAYYNGKNPVIIKTPSFARNFKVITTPLVEMDVINMVAVFDTKNKVIYDGSLKTRISATRKELLRALALIDKL